MRLLALPALMVLAACSGAPEREETDTTDTVDTSSSAFISSSPKDYLALGDSIAFGSNPLTPTTPPHAGLLGYPEHVAGDLRLRLTNAACSGETSGSFLDENALNTGCHSWWAGQTWPTAHDVGLKVDYADYGVENQADYAAAFLAAKPNTKLVTVNIGANDINLLLLQCGSATNTECILPLVPQTLATYQQHLHQILSGLRGTGYRGKIVVTNQYSLTYADPVQVALLGLFNTVTATVAPLYGAKVAKVFATFGLASAGSGGDPCAAGLLIELPDGTCDMHPSQKGHELIAKAVELELLFGL